MSRLWVAENLRRAKKLPKHDEWLKPADKPAARRHAGSARDFMRMLTASSPHGLKKANDG